MISRTPRIRTCQYFSSLHRKFTVLALESSADDTCAAVVTSSREILSNVVIKQHQLHLHYAGIHPKVAMLAHQRNMPIAVSRALKDANLRAQDVDGIAFTRGPGMGGCLGVGCSAAKTLAAALNKPLVGVHHMQAHALTVLLTSWPDLPRFPFLTLLVSGGHTLLLLAKSLTSFQILATTHDSSIGWAFDRIATLLDIKWGDMGPGPALEKFCAQNAGEGEGEVQVDPLPRVLPGKLEFSYAGLLSHVERFVSAHGSQNLTVAQRRAMARASQIGLIKQLEDKLTLALKWCHENAVPIRHLVVSGGVASNSYLRQRLRVCLDGRTPGNPVSLLFPPPSLCTDNAVMIAWASMHRFLAGDHDDYSIGTRFDWSIKDLTCSEPD